MLMILTWVLLKSVTREPPRSHVPYPAAPEATPARVINVSSIGNFFFSPEGGFRVDDLSAEKHYGYYERYGSSKLANILFTRELGRREYDDGNHVVSYSLHPGAIASTNLSRHTSFGAVWDLLVVLFWKKGGFSVLRRETFKTIPQGAATTIVAALDSFVPPSAHLADCQLSDAVHHSASVELQEKLWKVSEEMIASVVSQ
ncbi:hypothetical protein BDK51DRAFT_27389 [Blyttiomyces helicus]|uniref:Uncharacterized protein n=1 Tax=Blyttiomyces helicus TaxID=388810 RepID=A0A4P9WR90_9FUNG|nr:hypothetical protein BDK51DRAFT_27389 [Blyttiomyces helicus]|eukprot:RKO93386.1 hypothetical protein BDK51DRAFT_27389 [Blyttiomyces helicus]